MLLQKTETQYIELWNDVKEKLEEASRLYEPCKDKLVKGIKLYNRQKGELNYYTIPQILHDAYRHRFDTNPITESEISALETKYAITFPTNFRTFLMVCGAPAGGPEAGIYSMDKLEDSISSYSSTLAIPCPIKPNKGLGFAANGDDSDSDLSENEYLFNHEDISKGTIEIVRPYNPASHHLVVTGDNCGDVFWYNWEMLGYLGTFEEWYTKWLYETFDALKSLKL